MCSAMVSHGGRSVGLRTCSIDPTAPALTAPTCTGPVQCALAHGGRPTWRTSCTAVRHNRDVNQTLPSYRTNQGHADHGRRSAPIRGTRTSAQAASVPAAGTWSDSPLAAFVAGGAGIRGESGVVGDCRICAGRTADSGTATERHRTRAGEHLLLGRRHHRAGPIWRNQPHKCGFGGSSRLRRASSGGRRRSQFLRPHRLFAYRFGAGVLEQHRGRGHPRRFDHHPAVREERLPHPRQNLCAQVQRTCIGGQT